MYDKNRKLVDILINRHSQTIKNIINEFEIQPQVVVMDMFKPFRSVINSNIVQAQIVADKYHVIRQGIWALRDLRVELFNKDNEKYKKLKKYWKILSKSPISQFSQRQKEILKEILKVDKTLKKMYRIIKEFYKMFESKTVKTMRRRIEQLIEKLRVFNIKQSIKLADTITSWKKEIINIVEYKINNGFVEGNNNKIKVIKRVSYGLRNYERFRKLIYLRLCNR